MTAVPLPSIDDSLGLKLLPPVLAMVAGSADVIGFLGLGGLFVAHITGNLVLVAAHVVAGTRVGVVPVVAVPLFILAVGLTRLLVSGLDALGVASLRPLLLVQLVLLAGYLTLGVLAGSPADPDAAIGVATGMLGVCAMATQNALIQGSVRGAPTTAVMTTNVTRLTLDVGHGLLGHDPVAVAAARRRAAHTWPAVAGFAVGAAIGAGAYAVVGMSSLAVPTSLALIALLGAPAGRTAALVATGTSPIP